jgi:hypothetical protein
MIPGRVAGSNKRPRRAVSDKFNRELDTRWTANLASERIDRDRFTCGHLCKRTGKVCTNIDPEKGRF